MSFPTFPLQGGTDGGRSRELRTHARKRLALAFAVALVSIQLLVLPFGYYLMKVAAPEEPVEVEVTFTEEQHEAPNKLSAVQLPRLPPQARRPEQPPPPQKRPESPQKKAATEVEKKPARLKMVEVTNPESERAPEDARYLSDKNRRVEQETRARETNLIREAPTRPQHSPAKQPVDGALKPAVAEDRRQRHPSKRNQPAGQPDRRRKNVSPLLQMRARASKERAPELNRADEGSTPTPGKRLIARPRADLDYRAFDRIFGADAGKQRRLARLAPSAKRRGGKAHERWQKVRSALENFVPEVRPGNQTALGTRAHPFALYIARMHRRIHKLWGFGFLVDLDRKADSHPMNQHDLWSMIEIVVSPDGAVAKATVVKPSGVLTFDAAALDVVFSGGPYDVPPRAIRSADGKTYLHWRFHRDHRQCGTFGVDPYVLNRAPTGPIDGDTSEIKLDAKAPRSVRRLNRPPRPRFAMTPRRLRPRAVAGQGGKLGPTGGGEDSEEAGRLRARDVRAASRAADRFVRAYRQGSTSAMVAVCRIPFLAQGTIKVHTGQELRRMFNDLVTETKKRTSGPMQIGSVAATRAALKRLPAGAEYGADMLVARVTLSGTSAELLLQRHRGDWKVVGLNR